MSTLIQCPKCRATLMEDVFNLPALAPCPTCATPLQVEVFPALFRKIAAGQKAEAVLVEGESSCFYHPQKKAVRPCDGCGRFLCALCDCELAGQHFCPTCLDVGKSKGKIQSLHTNRTRHESIALSLGILSVLLFFTIVIPPILALISLYIAIRYWKGPQSIVGGHRRRMILAIVVALVGIAAATAFILGISAN
jgi:hypothetical protein